MQIFSNDRSSASSLCQVKCVDLCVVTRSSTFTKCRIPQARSCKTKLLKVKLRVIRISVRNMHKKSHTGYFRAFLPCASARLVVVVLQTDDCDQNYNSLAIYHISLFSLFTYQCAENLIYFYFLYCCLNQERPILLGDTCICLTNWRGMFVWVYPLRNPAQFCCR